MAATTTAVFQSQPGLTVTDAWPQTPQTGTQDLDLIHIQDIGGQKLAVVNYQGTVLSGVSNGLVLSAVAVSSFVLTQITASTGVILGTFTGGAANAFAGKQVKTLGFANGGNNGTFTITASSATQITVTPTAGLVDETHAGTASVYGVSTATYTGVGLGVVSATSLATVAGFTNAVNNVSGAVVSSSDSTHIVVPYAGQIAETHAGTLSTSVPYTQGHRVGKFLTRLAPGATVAALFADAFTNPSNLDILQVVNLGGNISYYLDYQGVAHGS
jgi:hypothetical protein